MKYSSRFSALLAFITLLVGFQGTGHCRTWRVSHDGTGDVTTVTEAISLAADLDTVLIMPGEYDEYNSEGYYVIMDAEIFLIGGGAHPADTRLRVSIYFMQGGHVEKLHFHDTFTPIKGSTGALVIRDCTFEDNVGVQGSGGAIQFYGQQLLVEDCIFRRNQSIYQYGGSGGAIYCGGQVTLRRCRFERNECNGIWGGAVVMYASEGCLVEDCVFVQNKSVRDAALSTVGLYIDIHNCVFYANEVTGNYGAALVAYDRLVPSPQGCIFAETRNGSAIGCLGLGLSLECCDLWRNDKEEDEFSCTVDPDDGNYSEDPLFCNAALGDFRLMEGSPCLPGEHGGHECGLIGTYDQGCSTPVRPVTWGRIKSLFR